MRAKKERNKAAVLAAAGPFAPEERRGSSGGVLKLSSRSARNSPTRFIDTTALMNGLTAAQMSRAQLVQLVAELIEEQDRWSRTCEEESMRRRRQSEEFLQDRMRQLHEHVTREHRQHMLHAEQRHEMQLETLRLETENRVEQARLKAEQEKLAEIQQLRDRYRKDYDSLVTEEHARLEQKLEDAKENCEHILKVNVAYIEKLQAELNTVRARCDSLDEKNQLLKRQLKFATQKVQQLMSENRDLTARLERIRDDRAKLHALRHETYKLAKDNRLLKSEVQLAEEYFQRAAEERDELYSSFVEALNQMHLRSSYKSEQVRQQLDAALGTTPAHQRDESGSSGLSSPSSSPAASSSLNDAFTAAHAADASPPRPQRQQEQQQQPAQVTRVGRRHDRGVRGDDDTPSGPDTPDDAEAGGAADSAMAKGSTAAAAEVAPATTVPPQPQAI